MILSNKLPHSSESIRDRLKRYLSKLSKRDEKVIIDANTRVPNHFIFFVADKSHNRKNISHISQEPSKITGRSLSLRDRKNVAKIHRRRMAEERERRRALLTTAKSNPDADTHFLSTLSPMKTMSEFNITPGKNLYFGRPTKNPAELKAAEEYKGKLRKREIPTYQRDTYEFDYEPVGKKFLKNNGRSNRFTNTQLEENIELFLHQLKSESPIDVSANAEILSEIVDNLALTFNLQTDDVVEVIKSIPGQINVEKIRSFLLIKNHN